MRTTNFGGSLVLGLIKKMMSSRVSQEQSIGCIYGTPSLSYVNFFNYMRCNLHYMRCILRYMWCLSYYMVVVVEAVTAGEEAAAAEAVAAEAAAAAVVTTAMMMMTTMMTMTHLSVYQVHPIVERDVGFSTVKKWNSN